jgi:hypothetical protein
MREEEALGCRRVGFPAKVHIRIRAEGQADKYRSDAPASSRDQFFLGARRGMDLFMEEREGIARTVLSEIKLMMLTGSVSVRRSKESKKPFQRCMWITDFYFSGHESCMFALIPEFCHCHDLKNLTSCIKQIRGITSDLD